MVPVGTGSPAETRPATLSAWRSKGSSAPPTTSLAWVVRPPREKAAGAAGARAGAVAGGDAVGCGGSGVGEEDVAGVSVVADAGGV